MGRVKESGILGKFDLLRTDRVEDDDQKALTYRVRGVPFGFDKAGVKDLLQAALEAQDVTVDSLAAGSSKQVATIRVAGKPLKLEGWGSSKRQWQVSARGVSMTVDTHFGGFTPLHDPEGDDNSFVDCVVISGLGSHAFGSWKDRESDYMWLRDALPEQLPAARVWIYGYDSKLAKSNSFQNLADIASRFRDSLQIALGKRRSCRPLIFIAHSLGGLVLKQAIIQMKSGDAADLENLKSTFAILFFGVPNQGMDIRSLLAMVHGQPNLSFLATLDKNNGLLYELVENFQTVFDFRDSHVVSFYETAESPTARFSDGKWSMTGEPAVLVDRYSAKSGRAWEDKAFHLYPINCAHSEMVKFPEHDEDCERVLSKLKSFAEVAHAVIRARWEDDTGVMGASLQRPDSRYSASSATSIPLTSVSQSFGSSLTLTGSTDTANAAFPLGSAAKDELGDQVSIEGGRESLVTHVPDRGDLTVRQDFKATAAKDSVHEYDVIRSSSQAPTHRLNSHILETQVLEDEARLVFNKTIGQNYRHGRTGYVHVGALFLTRKAYDAQGKITEVDRLRDFLEDAFYFETEHFEITFGRSVLDMITKISSFISSYNSPECLAIIYYGKYAYQRTDTRKHFSELNSNDAEGDGDLTLILNAIHGCLRTAPCDQLLIFDGPVSDQTCAFDEMGGRRVELLTSATHSDHSSTSRSGRSFAQVLNHTMRQLLTKYPTGFSTSNLYGEIRHAIKGAMLRSLPPMRPDEPRYGYGKIWLRPLGLPAKHKLAGQSSHTERLEDKPAEERFALDLTFTMNKRPDHAVMNELAMNLQFLPHVDKISFRSLYSPRERLVNLVQSVIYAQRVRARFRVLQIRREFDIWPKESHKKWNHQGGAMLISRSLE